MLVTGTKRSGEMITVDLGCHDTPSARESAVAAAAPQLLTDTAARSGDDPPEEPEVFTLATHYDYSNFSGPSLSMYGVDCYGGYVDLTGNWWDKRISSTIGWCPVIVHHVEADGSGQYFVTTPSGTLGVFSNTISSVEYWGW